MVQKRILSDINLQVLKQTPREAETCGLLQAVPLWTGFPGSFVIQTQADFGEKASLGSLTYRYLCLHFSAINAADQSMGPLPVFTRPP